MSQEGIGLGVGGHDFQSGIEFNAGPVGQIAQLEPVESTLQEVIAGRGNNRAGESCRSVPGDSHAVRSGEGNLGPLGLGVTGHGRGLCSDAGHGSRGRQSAHAWTHRLVRPTGRLAAGLDDAGAATR